MKITNRFWILLIFIIIVGFLVGMFNSYFANREHTIEEEPRVKQEHIRIERTVIATAYNSLPEQTDSTPWINASGNRSGRGDIACNFLPFGTPIWVKGHGNIPYIVRDRMNRRFPNRVDIWMEEYDDAIKFGKQEITIVYFKRLSGKVIAMK